ncbi:carboxymethylenebutenolidase [Kaistia sp. 32K]|uniref:dienelactone hydrolase family protein n=1 Tax=Kaistia sp. 32K TaxID=2795690 RepID=UPI001916C200|nr:dienelactone hydrolase family protein [Kaistia sp. 32K]BCP56091.1 carboxymethylenebutenolidase [Kaistia sp. 32K]
MTEVEITTPHHPLKAYVATPKGEGPWPGVIVLHDIFGLTRVTRGHADWIAEQGYLAIAPDLFSWDGRIRCIRTLMRDMAARRGVSFDDVEAVRSWLVGREDCTGKTGVIGFCGTGQFAILLAAGHGFSAAAPNYGPVPNDIEAIMGGACPVVASYGGRDWTIRGGAARLKDALERNGIENDVKEYPAAGHSFLDDHKGLIGILGAVIGASYKEKEAADARARIRTFFAQHLGDGTVPAEESRWTTGGRSPARKGFGRGL